jgi:uncharacterized repeat protein (TIGR01451 family)
MNNLMKNAVLLAALLAAPLALAQEKGHLNVKTVVQKEEITVSDSGERETRLVAPDTVVPGDSVIYTITFANISDESAESVVITNPVPENLTYIEGSAFGPGTVIEFSVDGGQSYGAGDELTVPDNGGSRAAKAEDYTHLRWVLRASAPY